MQAIQAVQASKPTFESQADKGINHPLVSCFMCDAVWRAHGPTLCPTCINEAGQRYILTEHQTSDLIEAISHLDENATFDAHTEHVTWEFHNLLALHAAWYDMDCRQTIQGCFEALRMRDSDPKIVFAREFFEAEFNSTVDCEMTYNPEVEEEDPSAAWEAYIADQQERYDPDDE